MCMNKHMKFLLLSLEALRRRLGGLSETSARHLLLGVNTYRTVDRTVALIAAFLDMTLQRTRVERLEQFKAAKQIAGD